MYARVERLLNKLIDARSQVCFDLLILFSKPSGKNNKQAAGKNSTRRGAQHTHAPALLLPRKGVGFQNISFTACKVLPKVSVRITACFSECATAFYWYVHANTPTHIRERPTFSNICCQNSKQCGGMCEIEYLALL
jgi:hypothetical protein